ncbi:MAG: hypothetical protein ACRDWH_00585, partial [Acidimicrobiia bacterium]
MSYLRTLALGLVGVLLVWTLPVSAQTDPYGTDPLGLIALKDQTDRYSTGTDTWDVWVCDVPDGSVSITAAQAASVLNGSLTPYFQQLSANAYRPVFIGVGQVTASVPSQWPDNPYQLQTECETLVVESGGSANGAIVVVDAPYSGGYATGGLVCESPAECPTGFPANARIVVLGSGSLVSLGGQPAALRTAAHEIGHSLFWPHSFAGLAAFADGVVYEYDNPMDLMSGGDSDLLNIGTIAINRYAAGWFGSESVIFHRGGQLEYTIGATSAIQLLVLPSDQRGVFDTIGIRLRSGYDFGLPAEGVEIYHVDQATGGCGASVVGSCFGLDRRTSPIPSVASFSSTEHVYAVGEVASVRGVTITVLDRVGPGFTIRVEGDAVSERFLDDNGNFHEPNIEAIAGRGITRGCNPPLVDRFCPANDVSRAE